ncbi:hypothetical protein GOBAR_DD29360 [Gossypium barbadense]|nr:hypothetical protein GOBAR_DD29360 [Gossypium barbadense]
MEKTDGIGKENGSTEEKQSFKDGSICGYNSLHHLLSANLKPQLYQVCAAKGPRPRYPRVWKSRNRIGTVSKSAKLVSCVKQLSNVKEEVYGALDSFIAWELKFPLITVKKALKILQNEQEWKRIIQVIKWMLSKGQGRSLKLFSSAVVITLYATGALNTVLSKDHQYEICRYLYNHQASNVHCVNVLLIFDPDRCLEHMNGQGIIHCLQKYGYVLTFFLFIQELALCYNVDWLAKELVIFESG